MDNFVESVQILVMEKFVGYVTMVMGNFVGYVIFEHGKFCWSMSILDLLMMGRTLFCRTSKVAVAFKC